MDRFQEIQENVDKMFTDLRVREKLKPRHQLIIESLCEIIFSAELHLYRLNKQADIAIKNPFFVQLSGLFFFEVGVLLKNRVIFDLNHILDKNTNAVSIGFLFNILEKDIAKFKLQKNRRSTLLDNIKLDRVKIEDIIRAFSVLINIRDQKLAHIDKKVLGNKYEQDVLDFQVENARVVLEELKSVLNFYISFFEFECIRNVDTHIEGEAKFGFETGIDELVTVVNVALSSELKFPTDKTQKIADDFKIWGNPNVIQST